MHVLLDRDRKEAAVGTGTMFSCVGCFWLLLTAALVALCSFSFISPAWIVKEQHHGRSGHSVSFGLLWHCSESLDHMYTCYAFGGIGKFAEIPSSSWQRPLGEVGQWKELVRLFFGFSLSVICQEIYDFQTTERPTNLKTIYNSQTTERPTNLKTIYNFQTTERLTNLKTIYNSQTTEQPTNLKTIYNSQTTEQPTNLKTIYNSQTAERPTNLKTIYNFQTTERPTNLKTIYNSQTTERPTNLKTIYNFQTTERPTNLKTIYNFQTTDTSISHIPYKIAKTSAVLCSGGCALLAVSSLLAIITVFLPSGNCERKICTLAGYMQMAAGETDLKGNYGKAPEQNVHQLVCVQAWQSGK
ncbi:hypothetical protein QTP86_021881 [Hemibagrus guttatus]|nr:hypothetical protein QTP86_021881 [Hemibagrus guttatus]